MKRLTKTASGQLKLRLAGRHLKQLHKAAKIHKKPAVRERTAAILKVAAGQSVKQVAENGLLVPRHRSTVYNWIVQYFTHGLAIWEQPRVRKRKLDDSQQSKLIKILLKSPQAFGSDMSRWTLALLKAKIPMLKVYKSLSGIFYLITSLRLAWIRCRDFVETIDPSRFYKIRRNRRILGYVRKNPQKAVMLFLDEFSVYRQPLRGKAWAMKGTQPKNRRSRSSNTRMRIVGAINAQNGQLHYDNAAKITVKKLSEFLRTLRLLYPMKRIYLVLDNWHNVHRHPTTVALLKELNIIVLWQPLYMPQSNPIEKLWWHISEQILRIHRLSDDWQSLKRRVLDWFDQFREPSKQLLEMVGLLSHPAIRTQP